MPVVTMLQRYLRTACATIHATRLPVLVAAVDAVTRGGRSTLTGLGHTLTVAPASNIPLSGWIDYWGIRTYSANGS